MLADPVDVVIGVDTHLDRHTIAVVTALTGTLVADRDITSDRAGYAAAVAFADQHAAGSRRAWAVEGSGSYGAGLARYLADRGEQVLEIDRAARDDRSRGKSDQLDAVRIARSALRRTRPATPRISPTHDALRVLVRTREGAVTGRTVAINELHAMIMTAPDQVRDELRGLAPVALIKRVLRLRADHRKQPDRYALVLALRSIATRARHLTKEADMLERAITDIVEVSAPDLLTQTGIGPISCAQLLISWTHPGRIHSEAAFARLAGAAPIPASSGHTVRYRLDRGGDRKLNRALHIIIITRLKHDPETIAYATRRTAEGKSRRDIIRILKRYLARSIWRQLEHHPSPPLASNHDRTLLTT